MAERGTYFPKISVLDIFSCQRHYSRNAAEVSFTDIQLQRVPKHRALINHLLFKKKKKVRQADQILHHFINYC